MQQPRLAAHDYDKVLALSEGTNIDRSCEAIIYILRGDTLGARRSSDLHRVYDVKAASVPSAPREKFG